MKVGVGLKKHAYTPEAYAYKRFLEQSNIEVQLALEEELCPYNEVNIYFMGLRPFWRRKASGAAEVHEYQSLSVAPYPVLKDTVKKIVNGQPNGRIFLNEVVREGMRFTSGVPYILRDMGVDAALFQKPNAYPDFDIVYSGSIDGRNGLLEEFQRLSALGYKLLIVGEASASVRNLFRGNKKVDFVGRVSRDELPRLYSQAWAGLNYTPDIYPFNIQTSTKTLEYLASGLVVFSNKYHWVSKFSSDYGVRFLWLDELQCYIDLSSVLINDDFFFDASEFKWDSVLKRSGFLSFISSMCE
ncbi:glycosyltransferase family protein [Ectopseudomonas guguanensis]|uniref:glycosyltransferase n=1 Tax=Ectopseudomonas guguanensis TaxID=1198456 RepID=UPI002862E11E|nr:glycosyltransferase [Pseudomonas guguanensis]MDR8015706.1 glycosyltransferase [Pseudomonas guguanensis]